MPYKLAEINTLRLGVRNLPLERLNSTSIAGSFKRPLIGVVLRGMSRWLQKPFRLGRQGRTDPLIKFRGSARTCLLLFRSHDFGRTQNVLQCESCSLFNMYLLNIWGLSLALLDLFVRMHGRKVLRSDFCLWLVFRRGGFGRGWGRRCLGFFYLRTGSLMRLSRLVFRGPCGTCRGLCIFDLTVFFVCDRLEAIFISQGMGQLLFCHAP